MLLFSMANTVILEQPVEFVFTVCKLIQALISPCHDSMRMEKIKIRIQWLIARFQDDANTQKYHSLRLKCLIDKIIEILVFKLFVL